jgi:hypothetical protein
MGRQNEKATGSTVGLEIDPCEEAIAQQERQHVATPPPFGGRNEDSKR